MPVPDACRPVDQAIRGGSAYAHTSHFRVEVDGEAAPPPTDQLGPGWRPAGELVTEHLLSALLDAR